MPDDVLQALERRPIAGEGVSSADAEGDPPDELLASSSLAFRLTMRRISSVVGGRPGS
jgi:hypothetical protein